MTPKSIVEHIKGMRSREDLDAIVKAAEARDKRLADLEAEERWKRVWAKYSHLKVGKIVFLHAKPEGRNEVLYGVGLKVKKVRPRAKEIDVQAITPVRPKGAAVPGFMTVTLTAMMCEAYKLSEEPTVAAFDNALVGETTKRTVHSIREEARRLLRGEA